ncbi:MAG: NAD(P)/FAD-dependent oxidoreductase, partial [Elusimicrobiota bacterium]|nr:NAD(P)/FAD-dependent oxidoreductase [Elusimicrobiota bacterium]
MTTKPNQPSYDVIVVGGGAAGMFAAGRSAENGNGVILLEKNAKLGVKLGITGNGRCNITNSGDRESFINSYGKNGSFLYRAMTEFSNRDIILFLERYGVKVITEDSGKVFPEDGRSGSVVKAFQQYIEENNVKVMFNARVESILVEQDGDIKNVAGVKLTGGETIRGKKVILATGGLSYPKTGSSGDGYEMAKSLGHTIVPLNPALVPLETEEDFVKDLQGVALYGVEVSAKISNGKKICGGEGDIIFTHFGISGPVILNMSGIISAHLSKNENVEVSLNLIPGKNSQELDGMLLDEFKVNKNKFLNNVMNKFLPKSFVPVFLVRDGIPADIKYNQISRAQRTHLAGMLADFRIKIKSARPIEEAMVTKGGVSLKEIDPYTMESKLVKGLYFCGEVIDIDGETGGYNLQAAFSTAYLAAKSPNEY